MEIRINRFLPKKPNSNDAPSGERVTFDEKLGSREIRTLIKNQSLRVLQTGDPVPDRVWSQINSEFLTQRPDVTIRVYGHYGGNCDLSLIKLIPNVRNFAANSVRVATGVEHIGELQKLESLSVGIFNLESFDFLGELDPSRLKDLSLEPSRSKKPSLRHLARFSHLEKLYLDSQQKDIGAISQLKKMQDLTLRSVTLPSLELVEGLPDLWSLDIKLGGSKNLESLRNLKKVKYLELWMVQGLSDIEPIVGMKGLQYLFLQALRNVTQLPDMSSMTSLRKVTLDTMKGLKDISPLERVPNLEEFEHFAAFGFKPSDYEPLTSKKSMKKMCTYTGNTKSNESCKELFNQAGLSTEPRTPFTYL